MPRRLLDERPRLNASTPQAAIEKALPLLYEAGGQSFSRSQCTSCHHNMLPDLAFSVARKKGLALDKEKVRQNFLQSMAWIKGAQEGFLQDVRLPGGDTTAAYLLWELEADGHRRDRATGPLVHHLGLSQAIDGGWRVRADRPPIESGRVTPTASSIRALVAYPIPGRKTELDTRIRRASKWLADYSPHTGEEKAMRLLGLAWAGAGSGLIHEAASQLASAQRAHGGWVQLDTRATPTRPARRSMLSTRPDIFPISSRRASGSCSARSLPTALGMSAAGRNPFSLGISIRAFRTVAIFGSRRLGRVGRASA